MSVPNPKHHYTVAEYIRREIVAVEKHEFHDGEILAMSGGTPPHSRVSANVVTSLNIRLRGKPCRIYDSNLRVAIKSVNRYFYPDASIICGGLEYDPDDPSHQSILNPRAVIEVLSPSTSSYDRGEKFDHYREIPTLQEYVLVEQAAARVEIFSRQADGRWLFNPFIDLAAVAKFGTLGLEVPLREIYDGVEFPPPEPIPETK